MVKYSFHFSGRSPHQTQDNMVAETEFYNGAPRETKYEVEIISPPALWNLWPTCE